MEIKGKVLSKNGKGVSDLRVEVWDKDRIFKDDFLGNAVTDSEGNFSVNFSGSDFGVFIIDQKPDLYFKVFQGANQVLNTIQDVIWNYNVDSAKEITLNLPSEVAQTSFQFLPPANWNDFPQGSPQQNALNAQWTTNLTGFNNQGIVGNPWNVDNQSPVTNYYNPANPPSGASVTPQAVTWVPFPGRINHYFGPGTAANLTNLQQLQLVDLAQYETAPGSGVWNPLEQLPQITVNPCNYPDDPGTHAYGPYGPRGWMDEYCEWAVTRNEFGDITRIDFTCENPEYWNTLWMIDPQQAVDIYNLTLFGNVNGPITLDDLSLKDGSGNTVTDPSTGRPAYNGLNKWNSGTVRTATSGGAMHLTSTPNTIQTEIGLGSQATILRPQSSSGNEETLICCAQYGQQYRNSDPHIGFSINGLVGGGSPLSVSLCNPQGLYIQQPAGNFSGYAFPGGTSSSDWWTVVRGYNSLTVNGVTLPGNFILHAVFQPPADSGFTCADVTINGQPIVYGGQIAQTMFVQIVASAFQQPSYPNSLSCVNIPSVPSKNNFAQPLQMFYSTVFEAMLQNNFMTPAGVEMNLLSNSTLIAPIIQQGKSATMVLVVAPPTGSSGDPVITFTSTGITANFVSSTDVDYAVPGNSYPGGNTALYITVILADDAELGLSGVYVAYNGIQGAAMPAMLNVVTAS